MLSDIKSKDMTSASASGKYICIPCWYIYDPWVGDEDSGIKPGTRFEDIPENWRCPVCWMSKEDFIPYADTKVLSSQTAEVIKITLLNPTTIEFVIDTKENMVIQPWQFSKILMQDSDGEFSRSYSVVHSQWTHLTFCVKLWPGRWSKFLSSMKVGDTIWCGGIFGGFILQNTKNPKVFIATGTWIAPIINMMETMGKDDAKILYFSVSTFAEVFYVQRIKGITNISSHISISQEKIEWFEAGRIDIKSVEFNANTEFYICWNSKMVASNSTILKNRGFTNIYREKFI